jgi:hypothetical protein
MLTPGSLETWLVCAAAVIVGVERVLAFWKNHLREQPVPAQTYVTRGDCDKIHGMVKEAGRVQDEKRQGLYRKIEELRLEVKDDMDSLHTKVNNVDRAVAATEATTKQISIQLLNLEQQVQRLPQS